ncbi:MAG: DNA adenine methylase [Desulfomonilaceae bacterium]
MLPHIFQIPGSKRQGKRIIKRFIPSTWKSMNAPFLGAGWVELDCAEGGMWVFASDSNALQINLWEQVLEKPDKVAALIERYAPFVKDEETYLALASTVAATTPPEVRAAAYHIVSHLSFAAMGVHGPYSRTKHEEYVNGFRRYVEAVRRFRCSNLSIECCDYQEALARRPDLPAYLDPPYDSISSDRWYGWFDHEALCDVLRRRDSPWICSYSATPRILDLYQDFRIVDLSGIWTHPVRKQKGDELLILSHDIPLPDGNWHLIGGK